MNCGSTALICSGVHPDSPLKNNKYNKDMNDWGRVHGTCVCGEREKKRVVVDSRDESMVHIYLNLERK